MLTRFNKVFFNIFFKFWSVKKKQKMEYPTAFLTKAMCLFYKSKTEVSADGTPRYIPNPNASGTYSLKTCMKEYTPIYGKIKK